MRTGLIGLCTLALAIGSCVTSAQAQFGGDPATYPAQTKFPKANEAAVSRWLSAARKVAGTDLQPEFNWRCLTSPLDRTMVAGVQHDGLVQPTRVFDQLYSIGQNAVSAWVLKTSAGLIVIDALNNPDEAREILVPNLVAMGLDPKQIRYVIVTHGHGDHWGGAKYLQDTYGAKVVLSDADWKMLESPERGGGPVGNMVPPTRNVTAADGDTITLGDTTVRLYVTPGHTPGTLSLIFPVTSNGQRHVVGLMGGSGGGQTGPAAHQQVATLIRWQQLTRAAGVDAAIANHPAHNAANERIALLRNAQPGDSNPFVYGAERYGRFMKVLELCSRVQLARMGETGD
ncbi:MAG: MBL fold metallo-hydrolase [Sphingomonas sp.]|nr:MBL fold metallo-hydrolase [Sphingomonas sp.]